MTLSLLVILEVQILETNNTKRSINVCEPNILKTPHKSISYKKKNVKSALNKRNSMKCMLYKNLNKPTPITKETLPVAYPLKWSTISKEVLVEEQLASTPFTLINTPIIEELFQPHQEAFCIDY